jgi:hypothetical protein
VVRRAIGALYQTHVYYVQLILQASAVAAVVRKLISIGILILISARRVPRDRVSVITSARALAIRISICYLALVLITSAKMSVGHLPGVSGERNLSVLSLLMCWSKLEVMVEMLLF